MRRLFLILQLVGAVGLMIALLGAGVDMMLGGRIISATPGQAAILLAVVCLLSLVGWLGARHFRRRAPYSPREGSA